MALFLGVFVFSFERKNTTDFDSHKIMKWIICLHLKFTLIVFLQGAFVSIIFCFCNGEVSI